ncbi:MAG: hypothetical protein ACTSPD_12625 [Promethearchaeota archaeon]
MNSLNYSRQSLYSFIILTILIFSCFCLNLPYNNRTIDKNENDNGNDDKDLIDDSEPIAQLNPQNEESGVILDRKGKIFSNVSISSSDCLVNRYNPNLNDFPEIYLSDWNLTYAKLHFANITAINYTYELETEGSDFFASSDSGPTYIYQKFSVELSQYVNNVSILIQDINNQYVYNDENSWEVSILNCSNDKYGSPDQILGSLKKNHPLTMAAHWELFDFKSSLNGPIFLDISRTNYSKLKDGSYIYWFALKVKIPPEDSALGGGPKFVYFNLDNLQDLKDNGEGDTFALKPDMLYQNFTLTNVENYSIINGSKIKGSISSFKKFDSDRFSARPNTNNLSLKITFDKINNLTVSLLDINASLEAVRNYGNAVPNGWKKYHFIYIYSINITLTTNISNIVNLDRTTLFIRNYSAPGIDWINVSNIINMQQATEKRISFYTTDPWEKLNILNFLNTTHNTLDFWLFYNGTGNFNVSINEFTFQIGELRFHATPQPYHPIITELITPNNYSIINGTDTNWPNQEIDLTNLNDDKYFYAKANSNNLSIEFDFNILPQLDYSLWNISVLDYTYLYPNPIIPYMYMRLSSNISITHRNNLSVAVWEIYKGNRTFDFLDEGSNNLTWLPLSYTKDLAFREETNIVSLLPQNVTWIILQLCNPKENNSLRLRLRYVGNQTQNFENFTVSIDEINILAYIQNAYSSDIASKIGLGLNSKKITPSQIEMTVKISNKEYNISNLGYQNGIWSSNITHGEPTQGNYEFQVSSIWNSIKFDVIGNYTIIHNNNFKWNYFISSNSDTIFWNVSSKINSFGEDLTGVLRVIKESEGLQIFVPNDWKLMKVYNCTDPPNIISISKGGWYWKNKSQGNLQAISVYNISRNLWRIKLNSSISLMNLNLNTTSEIKIDKTININAEIKNKYGGNLYFSVINEDKQLIYNAETQLNMSTFENTSSFLWNIFESTKVSGTYYLKVCWKFADNTHAFLALKTETVDISLYETKLELIDLDNYKNDSVIGTSIVIRGKLMFKESKDPIEGETIYIEIYDENDILIEKLSDITNKDGIIQIEYILPEEYNAISIKLVFSPEDSIYGDSESKEHLEITLVTQMELIIKFLLDISPYIIFILIAIFAVVFVRHRKLSHLREIWAGDAMILDDLLKINYIMIIHKDVGVSIYTKQLTAEGLDSDLISGFLQAISQFRGEIKKESSASKISKGFEMDYYDFKIVITDGEYIRVALILEGSPSEKLRENQLEFTKRFEKDFWPHLDNFMGDISVFRSADDLIELYFNIKLMYPLQLGRHYKVIKLEPLEKALVEVAEQIQKEKKFFFISNLLSYALAGRREERNQVISSILNLKKKGIIEPIEME